MWLNEWLYCSTKKMTTKSKTHQCFRFCLLVLRFYSPVNTIKAMLSQSANPLTLFLDRPSAVYQYIVHILSPVTYIFSDQDLVHSNWQMPILNQRKGENGRRNYFMLNQHGSYMAQLGLKLTTPGFAVRCAVDCFEAWNKLHLLSKLWTFCFTCKTEYRNVPKFSDRWVWANSVDPDQTTPWSGSTLFAIPSALFGYITLWKIHMSQFLG